MENYRIFVEKHPRFRVEADSLRRELNTNLNLDIRSLQLLNVYDLFGFSRELLEKSRYSVFGEVVTDSVTDSCDLAGRKYIAVEYLPGQFDQRAASAVDCVRLIDPSAQVRIRSSKLLLFDDAVSDEDLARIRHYYINAVESREKNLDVLTDMEQAEVKPVAVLEGFTKMTDAGLEPCCKRYGLAMNADDLREVVKYFRAEGRDPYETELRILDTYWSDHCRHTTFTTELEGITVEESFVKDEIEDSLALYLRKKGLLDDLEVSDENNACSVYVDVDVDGATEKWLLQFKNETHNHPTEIEPFGGASTCLGGAIRDPLSGRSYVYQAMRVTGAGNIYQKVSDTLEGKLPQSVISKKAALDPSRHHCDHPNRSHRRRHGACYGHLPPAAQEVQLKADLHWLRPVWLCRARPLLCDFGTRCNQDQHLYPVDFPVPDGSAPWHLQCDYLRADCRLHRLFGVEDRRAPGGRVLCIPNLPV